MRDKQFFGWQPRELGYTSFVVTAAFGTPWAPEIDSLRSWREQSLLPSPVGRLLVSCYYKLSPVGVRVIERSKTLREVTRWLLRKLT